MIIYLLASILANLLYEINMLIEREYEYKPKWWIILLYGGMFGVAAAIFAVKASSNDRPLLINGIIELSENGATIFYWVFCFLSLCFVLIAIGLVFHRLKYRQCLAFTASEIIVPASRWSAAEKTIRYEDITSLSVSKISGQKFLYIIHSDGKYIVNASMLPSSKVFEEVIDLLSKKIGN